MSVLGRLGDKGTVVLGVGVAGVAGCRVVGW